MTAPNIIIESALITKLTELIPKASMQLENDAPPSFTGPYFAVTVLFARPFNPVFGGYMWRQRGYMQVDCMYPLDEGSGDAKAKAGEIQDLFKRALSLPLSGITTVVDETPEVASGVRDGDRFKVIVKIRFYADVEKG